MKFNLFCVYREGSLFSSLKLLFHNVLYRHFLWNNNHCQPTYMNVGVHVDVCVCAWMHLLS